jgi:hypothetical protein
MLHKIPEQNSRSWQKVVHSYGVLVVKICMSWAFYLLGEKDLDCLTKESWFRTWTYRDRRSHQVNTRQINKPMRFFHSASCSRRAFVRGVSDVLMWLFTHLTPVEVPCTFSGGLEFVQSVCLSMYTKYTHPKGWISER